MVSVGLLLSRTSKPIFYWRFNTKLLLDESLYTGFVMILGKVADGKEGIC